MNLKTSRKGKHHIRIHIYRRKMEDELVYEVKEIIFGFKMLLSLLGFSVGSVLVGRSLWEYGMNSIGLDLTLLGGLIIFAISGMVLKKFHF